MEVLHYMGAGIGLGLAVIGAGLGIGKLAAGWPRALPVSRARRPRSRAR